MANIKIEFNPGDNIESSFRESIRISRVLGVGVEFTFNEIRCYAHCDGDVNTGVKAYHEAMVKQGGKYSYARC